MPDEAPWAEHVVVPDDLRDLQADVDAYHRELRRARRASRWGWLVGTRMWQRWSFPLGMLTGALALGALLFGLLAVEGASGRPSHAGALPLATTSRPSGSLDGLMPDVALAGAPGSTTTTSSRTLRPAVVALVPLACGCTPVLDALATQAHDVGVQLALVAPGAHDAEVAALPGQLPAHTVTTWYDATGSLARSYAATGLTVLVVDADGVVSFIGRDTTVSLARMLPVQSLLVLPPTVRGG